MKISTKPLFEIPNKLSALIYLALNDFLLVLEDERFIVDMGYWIDSQDNKPCQVCFAGAILAKTQNYHNCDHWGDYIPAWALALEYVRRDSIADALQVLGQKAPFLINHELPRFEDAPEDFINHMHQIAFELEEAGC